MTNVLFATCSAVPAFTTGDARAAAALGRAGLSVHPAIWDETDAATLDRDTVVVMRSVWDYHLHADAFVAWIAALDARGVRLFNSAALSRWNMNKRYLTELAAAGIPIVPSALVASDERVALRDVLGPAGWGDAVVKPAISASAYETWRTSLANAAADEARFARLLARGDVLVQPYMSAVESVGEWSLIFFAGQFSHAVRKRPTHGDFRVQKEHGGSAALEEAPARLVDAASRVIAAVAEVPLFARVDGIELDGDLVLMELECLDPDLFFELAPGSAEMFAAALIARL